MIDLASLAEPHVVSVAIISTRLLPIAFLCPVFGGQLTPTTVKLGLVLSLAIFAHVAGGISAQAGSTLELAGLAFRELTVGTVIGVLASLPFDAARIGGRFIDTFRGSSAEAALPLTGSREAAAGDLLYQTLVACVATATLPFVLSAITRSFVLAPVGSFQHTEAGALTVVGLVGSAFGTGLALGAPIAGVSLLVDALVGFASRAVPNMNLQDVGSPLRILAGGAVLWLTFGALIDRLLDEVARNTDGLRTVLELGR